MKFGNEILGAINSNLEAAYFDHITFSAAGFTTIFDQIIIKYYKIYSSKTFKIGIITLDLVFEVWYAESEMRFLKLIFTDNAFNFYVTQFCPNSVRISRYY